MLVEELIIRCGAYQEGNFVLKDGTRSDCFIDLGHVTGVNLFHLTCCLMETLWRLPSAPDILIGLPYKAIPLTAVLSAYSGIPFDFYRKEEKTHGETGVWVTKALTPGQKALLLDDVITSGATKREAICRVRQMGAVVMGILVVVDRRESEILNNLDKVPVWSLTTLKKIKEVYHDYGTTLRRNPFSPALTPVQT